MDEKTVGKVEELLESIAEEEGLELEEVIVFGSRAREDYGEESDIDILIVSEDFVDVSKPKRSRELYLKWDYENLPEPEFICLTPKEFSEKRSRKPHIVRTAAKEGTAIV
ncbi:hypothetical protein AKJ65_06930 [candidate division MSBL1 archaeon SCGC-AAA259E19]|uniref:Polymerase nucleotidyl transferase domain-containing protein n=1 Tax=candidate division MSBL1 archaeon SCGC-AAA259E19 TaxID=1698264 RepID=A0A133UFA9_9EURY|nr:hypothetical protein AKJ65_06930 [candidate division MSBL1 archaeon SCGC-AAA259E19]